MLYAERGSNGKVKGISNTQTNTDQSPISEAELVEFLSESTDIASFERLLNLLDTSTIRVLEDLIDLLTKKNVIMFSELPLQAQRKLGERKLIRTQMQKTPPLIVDDDVI